MLSKTGVDVLLLILLFCGVGKFGLRPATGLQVHQVIEIPDCATVQLIAPQRGRLEQS